MAYPTSASITAAIWIIGILLDSTVRSVMFKTKWVNLAPVHVRAIEDWIISPHACFKMLAIAVFRPLSEKEDLI